MPKFNVEVGLTVKALFTRYPTLEIEAESREAAEKYVRELLDKLENTGECGELAELNGTFVDPLDFDLGDCETVKIDTLDIWSIDKVK